jgi:hypothetical protein
VSVVTVLTPFQGCTPSELEDAFPDLVRPFKEHFVIDLSTGPTEASSHHRRNVRKALRRVDVEHVGDPRSCADEWCELYAELTLRHGITGPAAFSRESLVRQLAVPGLTAFRATIGGKTVGIALWMESEDVVYYHLAAYGRDGYESGASFALFATAIEHFRGRFDWVDLGSSAGLEQADDGLARFKRGWSTDRRWAYLCGRILDPLRYRALLERHHAVDCLEYFPAYRAPRS